MKDSKGKDWLGWYTIPIQINSLDERKKILKSLSKWGEKAGIKFEECQKSQADVGIYLHSKGEGEEDVNRAFAKSSESKKILAFVGNSPWVEEAKELGEKWKKQKAGAVCEVVIGRSLEDLSQKLIRTVQRLYGELFRSRYQDWQEQERFLNGEFYPERPYNFPGFEYLCTKEYSSP